MNVSEIIEQQLELRKVLEFHMDVVEEDLVTCEGAARGMLMDRLRRLYAQYFSAGQTVEHLQFVGPVATPEMQAEHKVSQEYKRERELAMKRKARVDLALQQTNRV